MYLIGKVSTWFMQQYSRLYIYYISSILINNVIHDTKNCLFWHTLNCLEKKNIKTNKQGNKQTNKEKCFIVDDDHNIR